MDEAQGVTGFLPVGDHDVRIIQPLDGGGKAEDVPALDTALHAGQFVPGDVMALRGVQALLDGADGAAVVLGVL